jgi:hypothetical protein
MGRKTDSFRVLSSEEAEAQGRDAADQPRRPPKVATAEHLAFAARFGVQAPVGIVKYQLFDMIWTAVSQPGREVEMISWFVYRVSRELGRGRNFAGIGGPDHPTIVAIAEQLATDDKVVKSARRYRGRDLIWFGVWTTPSGWEASGGSNATIAYKRAAAALRNAAPTTAAGSISLGCDPSPAVVDPPASDVPPSPGPPIEPEHPAEPRAHYTREVHDPAGSLGKVVFWALVAVVAVCILMAIVRSGRH